MQLKIKIPPRIVAILTICILVFLTGIYARQIEPKWLDVKQINVVLPDLDPVFANYRIVQITDLHIGDGIGRHQLDKVVNIVNAQDPDAIVLTGDYVTRSPELHAELVTSTLAKLQARDRTIAILGNHDTFDGNAPSIRRSILASGVTLLENEVYTIERNGANLNIAGVGDVWAQQANLDRVLAQLPTTGAAIMLAHEPDFADETAATGRFGLQLSGHSHGGQIRLPFLHHYPPLARKYPIGQYRVGKMIQYTSRGVGYPVVHARLNCRPEISVFNLQVS